MDFIFKTVRPVHPSILLENLVYIELRRRYSEVWFYKTTNNLEIDFIYKHQNQLHLVQVSYSVSDKTTLTRELNALEKAMDELNTSHSLLLTYSEQREINSGDKLVRIIPVWKFLLETDFN